MSQPAIVGNSVSIFLGNHGKKEGVADYVVILEQLLLDRGWQVSVSEQLQVGCLNLVIDEFTNYIENRRLRAFRAAHPTTPLALVLTEFPECRFGCWSLNNFDGVLEAGLIAALNVALRRKRDDFPSLGVADAMRCLLFLPLYLALFLPLALVWSWGRFTWLPGAGAAARLIGRYWKLVLKRAYLHMRYLGLSRHLELFDGLLASHEGIVPAMIRSGCLTANDSRVMGVVYPEFDIADAVSKLFQGKGLFPEVTGSVTPYRASFLDSFNQMLRPYGVHHRFQAARPIAFDAGEGAGAGRGAFSLHPPQTAEWPYSSPTRIFRAIQTDHNLPILTTYFGQHPIEDVCLRYRGLETLLEMDALFAEPASARAWLAQRLADYNGIAVARNDAVFDCLKRQCGRPGEGGG